jgi:nitrile hydratase subunit alpha
MRWSRSSRSEHGDRAQHDRYTLCSCYPTALLGPSPSWYNSFVCRSRAVREPRAVLAEFVELPDGIEIQVWDANSEARYLVLPLRAEGADEKDENELASLVTRNGLIGTTVR